MRLWLLAEGGAAELCRFDPGFGDDLVVAIDDPLVLAHWHLGRVSWAAALPRTRSTIHFSTRMFSPKPGQRKRPLSSRRNQFTV